jgi:ribosome-associated protein
MNSGPTDSGSNEFGGSFVGGGVELAPGVGAPDDAVRVQFSRGGGPGGQNVNKVNTRAELWVTVSLIRGMDVEALARLRNLAGSRLTDAGEIHIVSETHRTQQMNRQEVFERLREMIVQAQVRPRRRKKTRPSASAKRRRLESKRHRGQIKADRRHGPIE